MMLPVSKVDRLLLMAAVPSLALWLVLVAIVVATAPEDEWQKLEGWEQKPPFYAAIMLSSAMCFYIFPVFGALRSKETAATAHVGVAVAAFVVVFAAIGTNILLAFFPTVVKDDPVTGLRIFAFRYCEWIPMAGLMTFMCDLVDATPEGVNGAVTLAMSELISTSAGLGFAYCPNTISWVLMQIASCTLYFPIFPRVIEKRKALEGTDSSSFMDKEYSDRRHFAYHLLRVCSIVWTILVAMYYLNCFTRLYLPPGHALRHPASSMIADCIFDVLAKCFYTKVIVDIHANVFDFSARLEKQFQELRRLMQMLWDSTTDAIIISVQGPELTSTFLSPSFQYVIGVAQPPTDSSDLLLKLGPAVMLTTSSNADSKSLHVLDAKYVDSRRNTSTANLQSLTINAPVDSNSKEIKLAVELIHSCWNSLKTGTHPEETQSILLLHEFVRPNGEKCFCELKLSRKSPESFVAILRDVTERYKQYDAERRAHAEVLARQKDAQQVNRFTSHEIKNGLLSGIELCDSIQGLSDLVKTLENAKGPADAKKMTGLIGQLDMVLHEALDTVSVESTAKDVLQGTYKLQPKSTDLCEVLRSSFGTDKENRFQIVIIRPSEDFPKLLIDTQLLRYIHRNAISNANKYGKPGGRISTFVNYDEDEEYLKIEVVNEPGPGHEKLMAMGDKASNAVFEQGKRLTVHRDSTHSTVSAGDGAWIMQKCANNLGGACSIVFRKDKTLFTFSCPAASERKRLEAQMKKAKASFEVPFGTWGLGIDDSWIQRKLILRLFSCAGIEEDRKRVLGRNLQELDKAAQVITDILGKNASDKLLVLVEENLNHLDANNNPVIRSGSKMMEQILRDLMPKQRDRVLVLVRSAHDSAEDLANYAQRTHGFFSKTVTEQESVLKTLKQAWSSRFKKSQRIPEEPSPAPARDLDSGDDREISQDDLLEVLSGVDKLLNGRSFRDVPWPSLWGALQSLQGDLIVIDEYKFQLATDQIAALSIKAPPNDFEMKWKKMRNFIVDVIQNDF